MIASFLIINLLTAGFIQKWWFPQGVAGFGNTTLQVLDTDRDNCIEFIFTTYGGWPPYIYLYEMHLPNTWEIDSIPLPAGELLWDSGDFDNDGLYDIVLQGDFGPPLVGIKVMESPDSFSYPTQEVWRDTVGFALVQPISTYDVDKDSFPEIFKLGWRSPDNTYYPFGIYERISNNDYDTVFMGTGLGSLSSTIAFGDFDLDSQNEFVLGNLSGWYQIWECEGNNAYQRLQQEQLPTLNIKDCFSVPDADQDGKPEFVIKGYVIPSSEIHAFIFEATGDNTYEIINSLTLPGGDYDGGYSDGGDVDGDSIPEIVLEARQNVFIIKALGNDSFYIWDTLPGHASGSCVRVTNDIDGNGYNEVVISGNDETRIYEYDAGAIEETDLRSTPCALRSLEVYPNPFSKNIRIAMHDAGYRIKNSSIRIYDAVGQKVKSFDPKSDIMNHETVVIWYGNDDTGDIVPAGIYFFRFKSNEYTETKKIIKLP